MVDWAGPAVAAADREPRLGPMRRVAALAAVALLAACTSAAPIPSGGGSTIASAAASGSSAPSAGATGSGTSLASATPRFSHVYVVILENKEYGSMVGNADAPYINSMISEYGLATDYTALTHPSLPNYIALLAGDTLGVRNDADHDLTAPNLLDQLEAAGHTWHVYAQNFPGDCSTTTSFQGGADLVGAAGAYVRKHNPAISFTDVASQPTRCARVTSLAAFDPAAADFELIVPNMTNDMHDGTIAQGDEFLKAFVPLITHSPAFAQGLLVITWDEGTTFVGGGGHVATIVAWPGIDAGLTSGLSHDHYSLLRTIEEVFGLPCLARSCQANDLSEFYK